MTLRGCDQKFCFIFFHVPSSTPEDWLKKILWFLAFRAKQWRNIWNKVFRNGRSKICGRQPLKNLKWYGPYLFKFFKGCLTQVLLGPFWNTLSHIWLCKKLRANSQKQNYILREWQEESTNQELLWKFWFFIN